MRTPEVSINACAALLVCVVVACTVFPFRIRLLFIGGLYYCCPILELFVIVVSFPLVWAGETKLLKGGTGKKLLSLA